MTDESFKDVPLTLGEVRSEREQSMSAWTARDMLINLLRHIDNGLNIDAAVIMYRHIDRDGGALTSHYLSGKDVYTVGGLIARATSHIHNKWNG